MNALVLMLIPATLGVDFGWERQPDNSIEYILQIEPEAVESMKTGTELVSSLPPALRNIKDYRIRVGRDRLPNQNIIPPEINSAGSFATTQPNGTGNYAGTPTTSGYPQNPSTQYTATPNINPQNGVPQNNGSFANNSTTPPGQFNPNGNPYNNNQYTTAGTNNGTGLTNLNGPATVPTSTSGFPLQTQNATYPANTNNQYLTNLPPPPTTTYPTNGYAQPNPYPTGTAQQPAYNNGQYNTAGYTNTGYNQPGYNNNQQQPPAYNNQYNNPYNNQPGYQQQPVNPYGQQPQYLAQNPGLTVPTLAGPNLNDPRAWAAKPSITDPLNPQYNNGTPAGNFPPGTQFQQPGATPSGTFPQNQQYLAQPGIAPGTLPPANMLAGNPQGQAPFATNVGNQNDPNSHQQQQGSAIAKDQTQTQWLPLSMALMAFFASMGANLYFGWQNHYLRERCRMMVSDRAAY